MISQGGWSYKDLYQMPVSKRSWIFKRYVTLNTPKEEE